MDFPYHGAVKISASVRQWNNRPTLFVNGNPEVPCFYALTDAPSGRWSWEDRPRWNLAAFSAAGVRLFQVDLWLEGVWPRQDCFDISLARRQIAGVVDACPGAAVVFRLHVNPPRWWLASHPEAVCRFSDAELEEETPGLQRPVVDDLRPVARHSFASPVFQREMGAAVARLLVELESCGEGDHLAGVQIADGVFGEYHQWAFLDHDPDSSAPSRDAFRAWLRGRYGTERSLGEAWHDPAAAFDAVQVPGTAERERSAAGMFYDPRTQMPVMDYFRFQHECLVTSMLDFCRVVRESWTRPLIVGVFYGYFFRLYGRHAAGGHLEFSRVVASPLVDYLSAPQSYYEPARAPGGSGQARGLVESCRLHGKLWLDEMDQSTFLGHPDDTAIKSTLTRDVAVVRRNMFHTFLRGGGAWYYDFGPHFSSGWWDHPRLMAEVKRIREVMHRYHDRPYASNADVAVIFDNRVFYSLNAGRHADPVAGPATDGLSLALYQSGSAFEMYHLSDLPMLDLSACKAVVVANCFRLDTEQRRCLARLPEQGTHVVYSYLPGYTDGSTTSLEAVRELTGFPLESVGSARGVRIAGTARWSNDWHAVEWELAGAVDPLAGIAQGAESACEVLVPLSVDACATPLGGLGTRIQGRGRVWYASIPPTDPRLFAMVFAEAGAHRYGPPGDSYATGAGMLMVHGARSGSRELTLRNGTRVSARFTDTETAVFDADNGERLL